jgi:AcrR family transcriptional regulator
MKNRWKRLDKKGWVRARKIAKVAARLFSRKGFLATNMDEIANAAKISKGGMYYYFPSKADVLFFILSNHMDLVLQNLEQDLSHLRESNAKLRLIISRHIELYSNNLPEGKVLLHEMHCLPTKYSKIVVEKERKYYQIVGGVLSDLFTHTIPKSQLTAITFTLFGMCNWIYAWYDPKGAVTPQELSEIICEIFLRGVSRFSYDAI